MSAQWMRLGTSGMLVAGLIACAPAFAQSADAPLGATVDGFVAAGRQLSPALRAAALETAAAAAVDQSRLRNRPAVVPLDIGIGTRSAHQVALFKATQSPSLCEILSRQPKQGLTISNCG
jgi:hypothetical protein